MLSDEKINAIAYPVLGLRLVGEGLALLRAVAEAAVNDVVCGEVVAWMSAINPKLIYASKDCLMDDAIPLYQRPQTSTNSELLEALQDLVYQVDHEDAPEWLSLDQAKAAIAKAKGTAA